MFILKWICLGMSAGHGISFALFHIWVVATIRLGQYRDHLLKSLIHISVTGWR